MKFQLLQNCLYTRAAFMWKKTLVFNEMSISLNECNYISAVNHKSQKTCVTDIVFTLQTIYG